VDAYADAVRQTLLPAYRFGIQRCEQVLRAIARSAVFAGTEVIPHFAFIVEAYRGREVRIDVATSCAKILGWRHEVLSIDEGWASVSRK
jgi:hypothetical protein